MPKLRTRLILLGVALGGVGVITVANGSGDAVDPAASSTDERPTSITTTVGAPDPFSTNGTWRVPEQIPPGTYLATPRDAGPVFPYYEICATLGCDPFGTGEFIGNGMVEGPTYVQIPEGAVSVQIMDLTLAPVEG